MQNLETIGTVTLTSSGAISNAPVSGSPYSIVPSAATGGTFTPGNYAITYTNGTLTVNRAGLSVTANNAFRTYGAANPAFSASYGGFVNNENAGVVSGTPGFSTPATVTSPVGGYAITPSLGSLTAANYTFGPFNNGTLTINAAALSITASNLSKTYGQNLTFAGTEFSENGLLNSDTATHATLTSAGAISNAPVSGSPYSIVPSAVTGSGLTNYIIVYTNGLLTVNKAALGITATNRAKTYGQNLIFAGTEFVSSPLQNLETIGTVMLTSAGAISNAPVSGSPYSIVPSAATGGTFTPGNYAITYTNGTLTVGTAPLGITANNRAKTYGQTVTFASTEFMPSGLQNLETIGSVTLASAGAISNAPVSGCPTTSAHCGDGRKLHCGQLYDWIHQRRVNREQGGVDDHSRQHEQDCRGDVDLCWHGIHCEWLAEFGNDWHSHVEQCRRSLHGSGGSIQYRSECANRRDVYPGKLHKYIS